MRLSRTKVLSLLLIALFLAAILVGLKRFEVWDQITALENAETSDLLLSPGGIHPHALRFMLMMPVVLAARWLSIDQDFLFSLVCWAAITGTAAMSSKILGALRTGLPTPWHRHFAPPYLFLTAIALAMHGRIILSFTGLTLLVLSQVQWQGELLTSHRKLGIRIFWGFLLTSVSSGTLMVAALFTIAFILWMPLSTLPRIRRRNFPLMGLGLLLIAGASPLLFIGVKKNLQFFGGGSNGLVHMLNHGPGKLLLALGRESLLLASGIAITGLGIGLIALAAATYLYRHQARVAPVWVALGCSMSVGVFGFSTLLSGLPALFILIWRKLTFPSAIVPQPRRTGLELPQ